MTCHLSARGRSRGSRAALGTRPFLPMRLRVALRELRHSCALSAAEERALLKHCRTVESLATADFPRLAGTCALRADGLRLLAHELTAALAAELSRPGLAAHADAMRTDAILSTGLESLDALLGGGLAYLLFLDTQASARNKAALEEQEQRRSNPAIAITPRRRPASRTRPQS